MRTPPNKSEAEPAPSKPANAKPPNIASASVPDTLAVFVYAMAACLGVNDAVKVVMIKWRVTTSVA